MRTWTEPCMPSCRTLVVVIHSYEMRLAIELGSGLHVISPFPTSIMHPWVSSRVALTPKRPVAKIKSSSHALARAISASCRSFWARSSIITFCLSVSTLPHS